MHVKGGGTETRVQGTISPPLDEPSFVRPTTSQEAHISPSLSRPEELMMRRRQASNEALANKLPPRRKKRPKTQQKSKNDLQKIYGNMHDFVQPGDREVDFEEMRNAIEFVSSSPRFSEDEEAHAFAGRATGARTAVGRQLSQDPSRPRFEDKRMRGLETIYMQKLDAQKKRGVSLPKRGKPRFRTLHIKLIDDPGQLAMDDAEAAGREEISMMIANKLEKLSNSYLTSTHQASHAQQNMPHFNSGWV